MDLGDPNQGPGQAEDTIPFKRKYHDRKRLGQWAGCTQRWASEVGSGSGS